MTALTRLLPLALLVALGGCEDIFKGGDDGDTGGSDTHTDTDTDTDTDGDGGSGDGGSSGDIDCDDPPAAVAVGGPDCVTDTVDCSSDFASTTKGGSSAMKGEDYVSWYCEVVSDDSYSGSERVYSFLHPGTGWATFSLEAPCEELDLFVVRWGDDSCPTSAYSILECEGSKDSGDDTVEVWNNEEAEYLVVVDGPEGDETPFGLSISCDE